MVTFEGGGINSQSGRVVVLKNEKGKVEQSNHLKRPVCVECLFSRHRGRVAASTVANTRISYDFHKK